MGSFKAFANKNKAYIFLCLIVVVGIFLRTYHFAPDLRFGEEQARDAKIVRDIIVNHKPLPLLGPKAGETKFKIGPAFYYFQFASASIFGVSPEKMAYPDLFFSILTIPLLFLLLKKYFSETVSLLLTALYSFSFIAVQNSRFAWNPNSVPFFVILFLYAFLCFMKSEKEWKRWLWALLTGLALGIGLQLHTMYLLVVPLVFVIFSLYLLKKKKGTIFWKHFLAALFLMALLNIPQIVSEAQTGGQNTKAFIAGILAPPKGEQKWEGSVLADFGWNAQANTMFLTPFGNDSVSDYASITHENIKYTRNIIVADEPTVAIVARLVFGLFVFILGFFLLNYFSKKEEDEGKKNFLHLLLLYITVSFLILIPLAHDLRLVLRYMFILEIVPFIILGLLMEFLYEKLGKMSCIFSLVMILSLMALNIIGIKSYLASYANGTHPLNDETWGEESFAGNFITSHMQPNQQVYMVDEGRSLAHFIKPLGYFINDKKIVEISGARAVQKSNAVFFSLQDSSDAGKLAKLSSQGLPDYIVVGSVSYGRLTMFELAPRGQN